MKIDRHNYEEHFILYWDNELTASQKQAVENFVKENNDLQEEFKLLGKTRFAPDSNVQFEEKEFLLNNSFINITNYEEQFLNYIDDELSNDERKEVEKFTATHPAFQKELLLLQKTKLQPEAETVFPDKSILYRREEKVRVISMTWFRVAIAAAILLIAGFATIRIINNDKSGDKDGFVKLNPDNSGSSVIKQPDQIQNNKEPDTSEKDKSATVQANTDNKDQKSVNENIVIDKTVAADKNDLPKERIKINQAVIDPNTIPEKVIADVNPLSKDLNEAQKYQSEKTNDLFDRSYVTNTSRISSDNIEVPEEVGETSKDKGGLKEFLRKTTRVFERRTKIQTTTEDNKLLLGAFAVSLK